MSEYNFTWQDNEFHKQKTFYVYFYPINKEASESIDYASLGLPEAVNHVSAGIVVDGSLVGFNDSYAVDHVEQVCVTFDVPNSTVSNISDAKAVIEVAKLSCLGNLFEEVKLGNYPDIHSGCTGLNEALGGIKIDSFDISYSVSGKKTKTISQINLSCIATNISQEKRMVILYVSAKKDDISKLISKPSAIFFRNTFQEEVTLIDPGKSASLNVCIFDVKSKFDEVGIELPSEKEFANASIFPFLRIFGDVSIEKMELVNPTTEN